MERHNKNFGEHSEEQAAHFLVSKGYAILERNYVFDRTEIDIIAEKDNWIIFVEVKSRKSTIWGMPEEAVSSQKEENIMKVAEHYIEEKNLENEIRFDIIAIVDDGKVMKINHIEGAF